MVKTLFVIAITTSRIVFPSIPAMDGTAKEMTIPAAKSVVFSISSPKTVEQTSKAQIELPAGLKIGNRVTLKVEQTTSDNSNQPASSGKKLIAKNYWGCGETVPADQPKIDESAAQPPADATSDESSYAYWPTGIGKEKTPTPQSKAAGTYALTTNYCGGASVTLGEDQEFLGPLDVTELKKDVDLSKPITLQWTKVPRALGYVVTAYGGNDNESITWTSSCKPELTFDIENRYLSKENLKMYLDDKALLTPDTTSCIIPAGIFKSAAGVMVVITAVGSDIEVDGSVVTSRAVVRSTVSIPLAIQPTK